MRHLREYLLRVIVRAQAKAGDVGGARRTMASIMAPLTRALALRDITAGQVELGDIPGVYQPAGWFAPRYGLVVPTVTVCYRQKVTLPVRNTYVITEANRV